MSLLSGGAVPVVDLAKLSTPEDLAAAIKGSLSTVGFLFIINHGLEKEVDEMFAVSEDFFVNESAEEKKRCAYDGNNQGYVQVQQEKLDPVKYPEGDMKEVFNAGIIQPGPPLQPTQPLPSILQANIQALHNFQFQCFDICQRLLTAFAIALDLEPTFFTDQHTMGPEVNSILRFLHYPAVPPGAKRSPNRAGAHSDYGSLTLLFQKVAGGEGLQILPSTEDLDTGEWKDVGVVDNALLVNIGDAMEYWTGAQMKSTLHRVRLPEVMPAEGIPERYSMVFFCQPSPTAILKSVLPASDISENDLARMARKGVAPGGEIQAYAHLRARLDATYRLTA